MARPPNIPQKFGSIDNNLLYEALYQFQRAINQSAQQGRKNATTIQAANTVQIDNPVVRVLGTATIKTIKAPGFGTPIYFYAQDGFSFASGGGNIRSDAALGAGDSAIAQYDAVKDEWFIIGGGGPPLVGYVTDGSNVGGGAEIFKSKVGTVLEHRTIKATGASTATQNASDVTIHTPVPPSVFVNTDEIAYGDGSGGLTSQAPFKKRALNEGGLNVILADNYWSKRTPVINVKWFGATGNGGTDDTAAIQTAIDYAETIGGTVYFPAGTYIVGGAAGTSLVVKGGVSLRGENRSTTAIYWSPVAAHAGTAKAILDTTNELRSGTTIQELYITNPDPTTRPTIGILGGSSGTNYNSGNACFRNLTIFQCETGILGNGDGYGVGPDAKPRVGIFDSLFDNITVSKCSNGFNLYGSGNVFIKPYIRESAAVGMVFDCLSSDSRAGYNVYGGTFTVNQYDLYFVDSQATGEELRPTNFFGTWFEASVQGIASVPADIRVPVLNFQGCLLQSDHTGAGSMLDLSKIKGVIGINECTKMRFSAGQNVTVSGDPTKNRLVERDGASYEDRGAGFQWYYYGTDASMMLVVANAPAAGNILAAATTVLVWDAVGATPGMEDFDLEGCFNGTTLYTAKYPGTYKVSATVMLDGFPVAESIDLRISKNATVISIFHQNGTTYDVSMAIDAIVTLAVGDTLSVSIYNPGAAKTQVVGTYGFTNPHYNTFQVNREF